MKTSKTAEDNEGWTLDKLYKTNEEGKFIDDNNSIRLNPAQYKDYFLKVLIPEVGDMVRIKTREEMLQDNLINENSYPIYWTGYMEKHYYGKIVLVKEIGSTGRFTIGDGYVMHVTAIAEILTSIEDTPEAVPEAANTNKTIKENKMETTIKVNGEVNIVTEEAVVQEAPKTDLEQNYKYVVEVYDIAGTRPSTWSFRTKKEMKEFKANFFEDPSHIGFTLKVYKLTETSTTKVPVVTTKKK